MVTFGQNLKRLRTARGVTQIALARAMGYEPSSGNSPIAAWENEDRVPSPDMVVRFAANLGCAPSDLLAGVQTDPYAELRGGPNLSPPSGTTAPTKEGADAKERRLYRARLERIEDLLVTALEDVRDGLSELAVDKDEQRRKRG